MTVSFQAGGFYWKLQGLPDCSSVYTLPYFFIPPAPSCTLTGSTATVAPSLPLLSDPDYKACMAALLKGCSIGSILQCSLFPPFVGGPTLCCAPSSCGCENSPQCGCGRLIDALPYTFMSGRCQCVASTHCPPGSRAKFSRNAVSQATDMLARWQSQLRPTVPGALGGPGSLNVAGGNLVVRLTPPGGGAFDPVPVLTYNSDAPAASEFGYGWTASHKQTLTDLGSGNVDVTDGTGTVLHFTAVDGSGRYQSPQSTNDSLVKNGDGTWTQTQPDGFQVVYNTAGQPSRLASAVGGRWTLSYDGSGRVLFVTDPFADAPATLTTPPITSAGCRTLAAASPRSPSTPAAT